MRKIYKIATNELRVLFFSPIAWILLILFFVQSGLIYTDLLYTQETSQQLERPLSVLTKVLFAGEDGVFTKLQQYLFLYIPILTMGIFSREINNGSLKLLLSSPVTIRQIVFGKFLSMVLFNFILSLLLLSFIFTGMISIVNLDILFVLGGILGLYLLMCAYAAIGMFMSSLTSYQIVAAISTLAILAALNYIGSIGQQYDFVREITYWMSISGRADNFINGLISSKDIIYFILVIGVFLTFTIYNFLNSYNKHSPYKKGFRYAVVLLLVITIGHFSSMPKLNAYLDTTRFKDRTLTPNSQALVGKLDSPIKIRSYINVIHYSANSAAPENRIKDLNQFELYRRFIPRMEMDYYYYYDSIPYPRDTTLTLKQNAQKSAKALKIKFNKVKTPQEIQKEVADLRYENNRLVRYIDYKEKTVPLRMYDDIFQYPSETEISAAIKRLIEGPSLVGILTGNEERKYDQSKSNSYKLILNSVNTRNSIINQGFEPKEINIDGREIPSNIDVLIIADPIRKFSNKQQDKIQKYITNGGNLLIAGEPERAEIINPLLVGLGVTLSPRELKQKTADYDEDFIQLKSAKVSQKLGLSLPDISVITATGASVINIQDNKGFEITPILYPDSEILTFLSKDKESKKDSAISDSTDIIKQSPVVVALTRNIKNKNQKILIMGDADILSNAEMGRNTPKNINPTFAVKAFKWFSEGQYPVNTGRPKAIDTKIKLTRSQIKSLKVLYAGIIPVVIAGIGLFILERRRRH